MRIAFVAGMRHGPFFDYPIIDAAEYYGWATTMAKGEWLWTRAHIHGPLYPMLLAFFIRAGAHLPGLHLVNHVLGIASTALLYAAARRIGGRATALIASILALLYGHFLYFEGLLLATSLVAFLNIALLAAALELKARRAAPPWWIVVGVILGLSATGRPTALIFLPALLWWTWRSCGARRHGGAARAAAVFAGVILIVAPVTLRNAAIGDPVLVQANGGMNFYIANRSGADGLASVRPGVEWKAIERLATEAGAVREVDRDRFYYKEGLKEMTAEPVAAAGRILRRLYLFFGGPEVDTSHDRRWFRDHSEVLRLLFLPAGAIVPFTLIGLFSSLRHRAVPPLHVLLLLSYVPVILAFPYSSRYRMAVFFFFILAAAPALLSLAGAARAARRAGGSIRAIFLRRLGLTAGLFAALNILPLGMPVEGIVRIPLHLGKRLYDLHDYRGALAFYDEALARWGDDGDIWNNRGLALEAIGDRRGARSAYEKAIDVTPNHAKAMANLAGILYAEGKLDSARALLEEATGLEPGNADFCNNLGALLLRGGEVKRAIALFERGVDLSPRHGGLLYNLGKAYRMAGRDDDAEKAFRRLVGVRETKEARLQLGALAEARGDPRGAAREYGRALELDGEWPDALRALGVLLIRAGDRDRGAGMLQRYLAIRPDDRQVAEWLERAR